MYGIVDCNNFYASCERLFRPELEKKPIVVLSNNDGCLIARSNEAKALGIPMGVPYFKVRSTIRKHDVAVFSSNYTLYGDMSKRVMNSLAEMVPALEVYSIDEAFFDFSGMDLLDMEAMVRNIQRKVSQDTGIPVSIGLAPTKTLAKLANHIAKKTPEAKGVYIIRPEDDREELLRNFPIGKVWGIGRGFADKLMDKQIYNALDFVRKDSDWIRQKMSVVGAKTQLELKGVSCLDLEMVRPVKKGICTTRSFGKTISAYADLAEAVSTYAVRCAEKLRREKLCAGLLTVYLRTNRFSGETQYRNSASVCLPMASSSNGDLVKAALKALRSIHDKNYEYKRAGVFMTQIVPEGQQQYQLFAQPNNEKQQKLMDTIDQINKAMGRNTVQLAVQGGEGRSWEGKCELSSNRYTTRWDEILQIAL